MTDDQKTWDPNGNVVTADGWRGAAPMLTGSPKDYTASALARMFLTGGDALAYGTDLGGPSNEYRQSVWPYACITAIATNCARVPLRLSRGEADGTRGVWGAKSVRAGRGRYVAHPPPDVSSQPRAAEPHHKAAEGEIVTSGELYALLEQPNPEQRWGEFLEGAVIWQYTDGRAHWLFDEMVGMRVRTMYALPGKSSQPAVDKKGRVGRLLGWAIPDGNGVPRGVTLDECLTFQFFDPADRHAALSPRVPAQMSIIADYNASLYNASMFRNSCEPGTVLQTDAPYNPQLDQQMKTNWQQRHGGPANARRLAVLWGGLKHQSISQTLQDMVYAQGKQFNREETCAIYRVPASVAGFFGTTGDAAAYTDNELERFWQDTVTPLLEKIADAINRRLCPHYEGNLVAWFDVEDVPVFQRMRRSRMKDATSLFAMGRPFADINDVLDLGMRARPQDETGFLPQGLLPVAAVIEGTVLPPLPEGEAPDESGPGEETPAGEEEEDGYKPSRSASGSSGGGSFGLTKDARDRLWRSWEKSFAPLAKRLAIVFRSQVSAQGRKVEHLLKQWWPGKERSQPGAMPTGRQAAEPHQKNEELIARILVEVFDNDAERRRFVIRVQPIVRRTTRLGVVQSLVESGIPPADAVRQAVPLLESPAVERALAQDAARICGNVDARTRHFLRQSLNEGFRQGEGATQLADRVQAYTSASRDQALTQARNYTAQTLSAARREGRLAGGFTHEVWIHSRGAGERRPAHVAAEAHYARNPKPIGEPFVVNGVSLRYPRDPAGPPAEVVNCQCMAIGRRLKPELPAGQVTAAMKQAVSELLLRGFFAEAELEMHWPDQGLDGQACRTGRSEGGET